MLTSRMNGAARGIHAEIDPRIAAEPEQVPAGERQPLQLARQGPARPARCRTAAACRHRLALRRPFGVVAGDQRPARRPIREHGLGHRQHLDAVASLHQRRVELPPVDIGFGEMLGAEAHRALEDDTGGIRAAHHRSWVDAERAMLPDRLDDDARAGIEAAAVLRPCRRRQARIGKLPLGGELRQRVEPSVGARPGIREPSASSRAGTIGASRQSPPTASTRLKMSMGRGAGSASSPRVRAEGDDIGGEAKSASAPATASAAVSVSISSGRLRSPHAARE